MAKFTRKLNDSQRAAMIRRKMEVAARVMAKPRAEIVCGDSGGRSAARNTITFRALRKGGRQTRTGFVAFDVGSIKPSAADAKRVLAATETERKAAMNSAAALRPFAEAIGRAMVEQVQQRLQRAGAVDTGTLRNSIAYRIKNV